jgi:hypothetical protein
VGQEHRAAAPSGDQTAEEAGGFGVPEDPLGGAALADDLGVLVGEIEVFDVECQQLLGPRDVE